MNKILIKTSIILLLPLIMGEGCENDKEFEDITLVYTKCPCEHETNLIKTIHFENIVLYDTSKTSFEEMKELSFDGERSLFASYSLKNNSITLYSIRTTMEGISYFCNVPEIVKEWEIPTSGNNISFYADEFESCISQGSIATNTYSNYVLKKLKREIK